MDLIVFMGLDFCLTPAVNASGNNSSCPIWGTIVSTIPCCLRRMPTLGVFPPVCLMCGSRDFFLSGTSNFHRQLLRAAVGSRAGGSAG
jgi:hypothetical protein